VITIVLHMLLFRITLCLRFQWCTNHEQVPH